MPCSFIIMLLNLFLSSSWPSHSHCSQGCTPTFTSFLACKYQVQQSASLFGSSVTWVGKFLSVCYRNLLDFLCPAVVLLTDIKVVQVPHEDQSHQMWGFCQMSEECLIFIFLIRWPMADLHIGLLNNSDPWLAHHPSPGRTPCILGAVLLKRGNSPSPSWPALPKGSGYIHLSTPVMWVSPVCLCDPSEVVAL